MTASITLNLSPLHEYVENECGGKEFFFGVWSAEQLSINLDGDYPGAQKEKGDNWFALRNGANVVDGLLFPGSGGSDEPELVLFRGYLSEACIHSYSNSGPVLNYWSNNLGGIHNGVFTAAVISPDGKELNIITDLFGIGPIYYRIVDGTIFFSSTSALLSFETDTPDYSAWFHRILNGNIPGKYTLTKEINIADYGSVTTFRKNKVEINKWYDFESLPVGTKEVNDEALEKSEEIFSKSMRRCEAINHGKSLLAFSSGHDSRRILAHLLKDEISIECFTMQMPDADGFDVDAPCAKKIADDLGVSHKIFKYPTSDNWIEYDHQRLFSLDAQSQFHTWSVPFFREYKNQNICVYDGLGGDLFGYNGWMFHHRLADRYPNASPNMLKKELFPTTEQVSSDIKAFQKEQPKNYNQALLTFALWQTRKATSTWGQQQASPGQLFLYPYFDIEYIEEMLSYGLKEGDMFKPQEAILNKFWSKLAEYPGSRNIPENSSNIDILRRRNEHAALKAQLSRLNGLRPLRLCLKDILTIPARMVLNLSQFMSIFFQKTSWWSKQVVEILYWWNSRPFIIKKRKRK